MNLDCVVPTRTLDFATEVQAFLDELAANPHKLDRAAHHYLEMVKDFGVLRRKDNYYTMQLMTEDCANWYLDLADRNWNLFEENLEEGAEYQIAEIVLAHHDVTKEALALAEEIARVVLWPVFSLMYGNAPNHFSSIQLARYEAPSNIGTGWHVDRDSEATCTVSLAPERHTGGGTMIMPHGAFLPPAYIPPLRKGEALLFNGRTTLHRGLELMEGQRNLLVYWMTHKELQ